MSVISFIHELTWADLPDTVRNQARRCLLDTLGAALGGRGTELSRVVYEAATAIFGGNDTQLWLDGRTVSAPGAALAHGMTVDALDIHDGYTLVKGHAGAAIVPATLATVPKDGDPISGQELLTSLVVGYEVALRAGLALHATACDYHTSGAWNALGCAAVAARRFGLDGEQTRHALGIAEYHGPRSQMMRCIDHPTMVKDGSGWGALAGVTAAILARSGFTGAPAVTVEDGEVEAIWRDLGKRWLILDQYFKPYAVCRWAQPAITGALALHRDHQIPLDQITEIEVSTFHAATRLASRHPATTEEAQYSLPFPVAAALVRGRLGLPELSGTGLADREVLRLAEQVTLIEDPDLTARFPAERVARVRITLTDGRVFDSGECQAPWDCAEPPTDDELQEKFRRLACESPAAARGEELLTTTWRTDDLPDARTLLDLLAAPIA